MVSTTPRSGDLRLVQNRTFSSFYTCSHLEIYYNNNVKYTCEKFMQFWKIWPLNKFMQFLEQLYLLTASQYLWALFLQLLARRLEVMKQSHHQHHNLRCWRTLIDVWSFELWTNVSNMRLSRASNERLWRALGNSSPKYSTAVYPLATETTNTHPPTD